MTAVPEWPRPHRLTVAEYHTMARVGVLRPDERVELIEGEIIDMPPIGSRHAGTVDYLAEALRAANAGGAIVRIQGPVTLDLHSQPEPDIALLRPRGDYYRSAHPVSKDVLLLVEVADTSLRYDRAVKIPLYARSAIAEVWLVDLVNRELVRHLEPEGSEYRRVERLDARVAVPLSALDGTTADLSALFN